MPPPPEQPRVPIGQRTPEQKRESPPKARTPTRISPKPRTPEQKRESPISISSTPEQKRESPVSISSTPPAPGTSSPEEELVRHNIFDEDDAKRVVNDFLESALGDPQLREYATQEEVDMIEAFYPQLVSLQHEVMDNGNRAAPEIVQRLHAAQAAMYDMGERIKIRSTGGNPDEDVKDDSGREVKTPDPRGRAREARGEIARASMGDAMREARPEHSYADASDPTIVALGASPEQLDPRAEDRDLRIARSMANIPRQQGGGPQFQPPQQPPQPGVVRGYGGASFLGNDDLSSQAAGNYNPYPGNGARGPPAPRPGGDVILNPAKASRNNTTDSLRPYFRIGGPANVSPSESEQLASRILHADFGTVVPGSSLGVTNKLFQMNQLREKNIHYMGPLPLPRPYDGPSGLVVPEPIEWQNLITKNDRDSMLSRELARDLSGVVLEARSGASSLNITGDDFGQMSSVSARGLKRDADSPLEPIIRLPSKMQRVKLADGFALSHRQGRRLFDAQRYPERFEPNVAQSGGSTYSRRSALSLYPFPVG